MAWSEKRYIWCCFVVVEKASPAFQVFALVAPARGSKLASMFNQASGTNPSEALLSPPTPHNPSSPPHTQHTENKPGSALLVSLHDRLGQRSPQLHLENSRRRREYPFEVPSLRHRKSTSVSSLTERHPTLLSYPLSTHFPPIPSACWTLWGAVAPSYDASCGDPGDPNSFASIFHSPLFLANSFSCSIG